MAMRVYYDSDCDINLIKDKNVLIVGYGSQGHAHANNLKDSGCKHVKVGLRPGSASASKAEAAGLEVTDPASGAAWADVTMVLVPDELQADLWVDSLRDNMKQGSALAFAHGLNIHFQLIEARPERVEVSYDRVVRLYQEPELARELPSDPVVPDGLLRRLWARMSR